MMGQESENLFLLVSPKPKNSKYASGISVQRREFGEGAD